MLPEKDGLKEPWAAGTFANPPYEELQKWLKKSADEYQAGVREQILLVPARPRARWWCDYMHDIPTAIAWLKRIKFRGYTSSYPEALVLVYAGTFVAGFKAQVTSAGIANLISGRLREH